MTPLAVVIPCHNPRRDYFQRVLDALKTQTLSYERWTLLVVDNASSPPLADWVDLSWHPESRIVTEKCLGLTAARLRGFNETTAGLIVLVDDDNVLSPDYLERARDIAEFNPRLGAFGGLITPDFEQPPPEWTRPYWGMLGIRDVPASVWSNDMNHWVATPIGAGLCVRKEVADRYAEGVQRDPIRRTLDRQGSSLMSGGDIDLVYTGLRMGYGMGVFRELRLSHLIPPRRLTAEYLYSLSEAIGYSSVILDVLWGRVGHTVSVMPSTTALLGKGLIELANCFRKRHYIAARKRGAAKGQWFLKSLQQTCSQQPRRWDGSDSRGERQ